LWPPAQWPQAAHAAGDELQALADRERVQAANHPVTLISRKKLERARIEARERMLAAAASHALSAGIADLSPLCQAVVRHPPSVTTDLPEGGDGDYFLDDRDRARPCPGGRRCWTGDRRTAGAPRIRRCPREPPRRRFTAQYKLDVVAEYDAAPPGEKGAVLRREGLYSSHVIE